MAVGVPAMAGDGHRGAEGHLGCGSPQFHSHPLQHQAILQHCGV